MSDILNDLVEQGKGTDFRDRYIRILTITQLTIYCLFKGLASGIMSFTIKSRLTDADFQNLAVILNFNV